MPPPRSAAAHYRLPRCSARLLSCPSLGTQRPAPERPEAGAAEPKTGRVSRWRQWSWRERRRRSQLGQPPACSKTTTWFWPAAAALGFVALSSDCAASLSAAIFALCGSEHGLVPSWVARPSGQASWLRDWLAQID